MIMHIVGNRPQFIKLAPLSKEIKNRGYKEMIIHTGQHYDENMSDIFFSELGISKPDLNLQIGSGTHAEMTSKCLIRLEEVFLKYKPSAVILYGDTDSTLSAALAAAKLNIPICHVEAGPRTYKRDNPEEQNRVIVDHLSTLLFAPDKYSYNNLLKENISSGVYQSGDIMLDTFLKSHDTGTLENMNLQPKDYVLMTWHRQENTCSRERMQKVLNLIDNIPYPVICPMHPRTRVKLEEYNLMGQVNSMKNFMIIEPIGYFSMMDLMKNCRFLVTDSGGASKESFFAKVRCLFFVDLEVWTDLLNAGWILKVDLNDENNINDLIKKADSEDKKIYLELQNVYGTGHTAELIVDALEKNGYVEEKL